MTISAEASQWAGSLRIGVTSLEIAGPVPPVTIPQSMFEMPADTWFIVGSQVRHNNTILKLNFSPSLDWLLPGDHVGIVVSSDSSLRLLVNSEDIGVAVTTVPRVSHQHRRMLS